MEYTVLVVDENVNLPIVEGVTNSTGANALLTKFANLNRNRRTSFMNELIDTGSHEHTGKRGSASPYTIAFARRTA